MFFSKTSKWLCSTTNAVFCLIMGKSEGSSGSGRLGLISLPNFSGRSGEINILVVSEGSRC